MADRLALRVPEAAELLGVPLSTCYQWASEGRIPTLRVGRVVLIPKKALEAWLERESQPGRAR